MVFYETTGPCTYFCLCPCHRGEPAPAYKLRLFFPFPTNVLSPSQGVQKPLDTRFVMPCQHTHNILLYNMPNIRRCVKTQHTQICPPPLQRAENYKVCGNPGMIYFSSPEYQAFENSSAWAGVGLAATYGILTTEGTVRVTVARTGGGYGTVGVKYRLRHGTTDAADVTSHAHYTTRCGWPSQNGLPAGSSRSSNRVLLFRRARSYYRDALIRTAIGGENV